MATPDADDARAADIANQLEAIADMLAASAGTGDGVIPPPGSPGDIDFERALDEAFRTPAAAPTRRYKPPWISPMACSVPPGASSTRPCGPSSGDYTAGRITHAGVLRGAPGWSCPTDEVERQRRERVASATSNRARSTRPSSCSASSTATMATEPPAPLSHLRSTDPVDDDAP